jgi:PKD repeat protein
MLRGLQKTFYHQTVNSKQIEDYIIQFNNMPELKFIFDQYLRTTNIPSLEYYLSGTNNATLNVRFANCVAGFKMKTDLPTGKSIKQMLVTDKWQKVATTWKANADIQKLFNANYFVNYERVR